MMHWFIVIPLALLLSCHSNSPHGFVSSATMESDQWNVSPTVLGVLTEVFVREGDSISTGQKLASIDSIPWVLKKEELQAVRGELKASIRMKNAELKILQATHTGLERELNRAKRLLEDKAITPQKKEELETQVFISNARIAAAYQAVQSLESKFTTLHAQENSINDQIQRCQILSPIHGRVLTRYKNPGETVQPGKPVVEIGKTDTLWADFYVNQTQLSALKIGQSLRIRLDSQNPQDSSQKWLTGTLKWISDKAEFTPKGVQTREARNELVFRARVYAANRNGVLKNGMPVEIWE